MFNAKTKRLTIPPESKVEHSQPSNWRVVIRTPYFVAFACLAFLSSHANACSIPVFRYALEHWRPDPYVAYIFHKGELSDEQQKLVTTMKPKAFDGLPAANVLVKTIDLNSGEIDERSAAVWEANQSETLPHIVIHSQPKWGLPPTIFSGEFNADNVANVMGSPLRTTIRERLLKGDSVVWVFLESGLKVEDDLAYELLNKEVKRLQTELKLPDIDEQDLGDLTVAPDSLKIKFSAVRLSRDDPQEKAFMNMLLHVEPDLMDEPYVSQPMAFPVFGRGRALYALVGDGLAPDLIEEACQFLTGACQCTVKRENPGVDLLMNVDWDRFVQPTEAVDSSLPPLAGFTGFGETETAMPETNEVASMESETQLAVATTTSETATPDVENVAIHSHHADSTEGHSASRGNALSMNVAIVLLLAAAVVIMATFFLTSK